MKLDTLIAEAGRLGLRLSSRGDHLLIRGPTAAMTEAVKASLKQQKPELVERLRRDAYCDTVMLLITAAERGIISEDRYWELCEQADERAAICEYDGGMTCGDAAMVVFEEIRAATP